METFDEYLSNLLVNCRESAIDELRSNKRYAEREKEQSDIRIKLEAVSPEVKKLVEEYFGAVIGVHAMECNAALLCGLTVSAELKKRFDASTPEKEGFEPSRRY